MALFLFLSDTIISMTINAKQLEFILDNTPASQNIMLMGKHGIGKSRILEGYFSKKGQKVVTLFLGQMADPSDLLGLPEKNKETGKTDFMVPYWFPTDGKPIVLFLDELNRARPEVLQTIMDLTLNRKLAGKSLPAGSRIISAVNNGNEYQLTDLDPALVSRFNIYEFAPTVSDWLKWAEGAGVDSRILNFISANPEYLDSGEVDLGAANLERTPDRRSWERVSKIICNFPQLSDLHKPIVSGILGNKATALFFRFVTENNIPAAKEILSDFSSVELKLKKLSLPQLTGVSESLFKYLEAGDCDAETFQDLSSNLLKYFAFLEEFGKESVAHFASLWSANRYPKALSWIGENCIELYKKLMEDL